MDHLKQFHQKNILLWHGKQIVVFFTDKIINRRIKLLEQTFFLAQTCHSSQFGCCVSFGSPYIYGIFFPDSALYLKVADPYPLNNGKTINESHIVLALRSLSHLRAINMLCKLRRMVSSSLQACTPQKSYVKLLDQPFDISVTKDSKIPVHAHLIYLSQVIFML